MKLDRGERRVDVDDLVALAVALGVSPNRLLLPAAADDEPMRITPDVEVPASTAWKWASGDNALPQPWGDSGDVDATPITRFRAENRPHDPPADLSAPVIQENREVYMAVHQAVSAAVAAGISPSTIKTWVDLAAAMTPEWWTQDRQAANVREVNRAEAWNVIAPPRATNRKQSS